jgi:hypothetical protein
MIIKIGGCPESALLLVAHEIKKKNLGKRLFTSFTIVVDV